MAQSKRSTDKKYLYNPKLKVVASRLRSDLTFAEKRLWFEYLSAAKYRFYRQRPIGPYIVDFYCSKLRLVIEVDGDTHYEGDGAVRDEVRTDFLISQGLTVLRFTNNDILENLEGVVEKLERLMDA